MLDTKESLSITSDGDRLYAKAKADGVETVWERHTAQQPQCGFCDMGLSCRICVMGPCRVDPFGEGPQAGVCGADADIIVARNLCRMVAAGAASHSDHGRDLVEVLAGVADGSAIGYKIRYVPTTLPDLLKTEDVIRYEHRDATGRPTPRRSSPATGPPCD